MGASVRPDAAGSAADAGLPPLHRILTPAEFYQAQQMSPGALASNPFPLLPPAAPKESTRVGPGPANPSAVKLTGVQKTASDAFGMGASMMENVPASLAGMAAAPVIALWHGAKAVAESQARSDANRMGIQGAPSQMPQLSDEQRSAESHQAVGDIAQLVATVGAGPAEEWLGQKLLPLVGLLGATVIPKVVVGSAVGAAFNPQNPGAGAALGSVLGMVHAHVAGEEGATRLIEGAVREHVQRITDALNTVFDPASRSPEAGQTANILRATTGAMAARYEHAAFTLDQFRRSIDPLSDSEKLAFIDHIEHGEAQAVPELQPAADAMRTMLDTHRQAIQDLGTGKLQSFIKDYFPHIWEDPERASTAFEAAASHADATAAQNAADGTIIGEKVPAEQAPPSASDIGDILRQTKANLGDAAATASGETPVQTNPDALAKAKMQAGGKRPMEGSKNFLKQRTIPTTKEGMDMGLVPVTTNPIDLTLLKLREMQRYLMAHESLGEMKDAGLVQFVRAGEMRPDGYAPIDDKIATVFGPRTGGVTLPEGSLTPGEEAKAPAVGIRDENGKLRRNLANVPDEELSAEWQRLAELNGTQEAQHSAVQEAGYRADYEALPRTEKLGHKGKEDLPDADGTVDPERLLADNKTVSEYNRSTIVRAARAKAMQRIEAEMQGRPSATDFNYGANVYKNGGGLDGFRKLRPDDVQVFGTRIMGQYHAPEPVASLVNNYLSPGLRGNAIYDAYRGLGNTLNQAQLGLSAFHLGFTSLDAMTSRAAVGIEHLASGNIGSAAAKLAAVPLAPFPGIVQGTIGDLANRALGTDYQFGLGAKIRAAYLKPEDASPQMQALANAVKEAGGRIGQDSFYRNSAPEKLVDAWKAGEYGKAMGLSVPALFEMTSRPLMEHIVPLQKLQVFGEMAQKALADLPDGASINDRRQALGEAWNSTDNRMGQLVYDNLFWNKTFKDLAMAGTRSVGWNLGTIRELGGGIGDLAGMAKDAVQGNPVEMTHKAAYAVALPLTVGMMGAAYQYLRTGEGPQELKDYFYPKTGDTDADGNPERVQLPSYMKDVVAYGTHPVTTFGHKMAPLIESMHEMLTNSDYYGDQIRNPDDPLVQQIGQEAKYIASSVTPFALQNARESKARGDDNATKIGNWFGVTPAPREAVRSDAQNQMQKYLDQHRDSGATPEEVDARQSRYEILHAFRSGQSDDIDKAVSDALERHQVTPPQIARMLKEAGTSPAAEKFKSLTLPQALDVFQRSTPSEKARFAEALLSKLDRAGRSGASGSPSPVASGTPSLTGASR